ncbi:Hypothetical predicted protein [Lecanosticta acicola]|uniref:WSC domain-containing protein n=1 Tax=Lecanosticta acicola TaxID=111012 RepID=A0AAI8YSX1_9PEZI|nr:Hypothetical predicted protein [Lecanosticta acicola]
MRSFSGSLAAFTLFQLNRVDAFWRMNCSPIQSGRVDPLVNPGALAAHNHAIVGAANIGINATYDSLLNSECTSCEISGDKSAYWTPTLYYNYANGSFVEVPHAGSVVYYLGRGPNVNSTIPFPKGLNILSGDKSARSYDNTTYTWGNATYPGRPVADRISFNCLAEETLVEQPYMFRTDCPYGLRAQVHFQSCWNGKNLYLADNSHVAYQSSIDNGVCPPTHPIQLPHLFLETLWSVANVPGQNDGGRFVFAQGDPTGYGFHGDFQNGWEASTLANAVENCLSTDNFGQIEACPVLYAQQSDGYPYNCPQRPPQIGEQTTGLLSKLPGCIEITEGPGAAPAASMNCPANSPTPSVTRTVDTVARATQFVAVGSRYGISNSQIALGCYNDSAVDAVRTLNAVSISNYSIMTVEYCQNYCNSRGYRLSGVEYGQECHCDNAINPTAVNGSDACSWNCGGTMTKGGTQEVCGGLGYINIFNNTDPSFVANGSDTNSAGNVSPPVALSPFPSNYVGCATDQQGGGRALTGPNVDWINMTTAVCASYCSSASPLGYQYYATEYGTQCFCGNAIATPNFLTNTTSTPNNSTCNMRCSGAGDELCGGSNALSVYQNTTYVAPKIKTPIGKFLSKQCYTDPNTNGRALTGAYMTSPTLTEDSCVKYCLGKYFHYAGVEYGNECYCGNSINAASGAVKTTCPVANMMPCAGNGLQYCGGSALLTLYYSSTL